MDALDEELAKLKLLKSRPLSPNSYGAASTYCASDALIPEGKVAALANNFQQSTYISIPKNALINGQSKQISPSGISPKKVGPIVPPKPQKQFKLPEVPQSMVVKQVCEPLYSKRLQSNGARNDGNVQIESPMGSRPPILNRKQPTYATQNSLYNKMNKVSLDNPAILEQQLEALAHHKMQMEKKGLLQHQGQKSSSSFGAIASSASIPKLSTASYLNDFKKCNGVSHTKDSDGELSNVIYSNLCISPNSPTKPSSDSDIKSVNVYSNITINDNNHVFGNNPADVGIVGSGVYHNLLYENDAVLDLPSPPPAVFSATNHESTKYLKNQNDDEIPPPPSPVSSSYSELRRATDIFSKNLAPMTNQQQSSTSNIRSDSEAQANNLYYPQYVENSNAGKSVATGQQNYMNMTYNNEYGSYNESPSLQSISQGSSDYYGYGSFSQGSSTYESIYEPINPPSQLSARSNYLLYVQYINGAQAAEGSNAGSSGNISSLTATNNGENPNLSVEVGSSGSSHMTEKQHSSKEAEVEALTDFLVHSMDSTNDADSYGVCVKCNDRVVGENSGCTAMDQVYHISCFTCSQCQINLQGKPFYALEGNPYCEYDYLQTLEKCSVCMKPILERILRATGKPYHPQCFTCVVCGNSLDGIPFTVDATNQNYCIADFHKKFAPRCCVCKEPIMPEQGQEETVRVVALDRSFHFECYKCEDCGLLLSSEAEGRGCYPLDDHVLCKSCNAKRVQMLTNRMTTEL